MTAKAPLKPVATDRKIEQKWGTALAASGWTGIPNVLFQRQRALGLTSLDVNIILQLAAYWWEPGQPAPSVENDDRGRHWRRPAHRAEAHRSHGSGELYQAHRAAHVTGQQDKPIRLQRPDRGSTRFRCTD
ncbi:hypothetical protein [Variovorax rhizosphaerae]|uniref:Uncharacterized protein n=1 Tax=Variovorax rhizosphaerae TaxID=1836200 RepID=A0ABU8X1H4_9BURK